PILLAVLMAVGWAQSSLPNAPSEQGANLPAQPIGANDLLAISVYGAPELTRTVRVSDEGLMRLPMLKERIDVLGLMPAALEKRIAEALVNESGRSGGDRDHRRISQPPD